MSDTSKWSLPVLLAELHEDIEGRLERARKALGHTVVKGDASESVWIELLDSYLPKRYQAAKAHVVDSKGVFSDQIDVVVFDRQYSPFIFKFQGATIIPAESVYAVFEAKQTIDAGLVRYAQEKSGSVRRLHRTSLSIPHAGGIYDPKPLTPIMGGFLSFESDWSPALGQALTDVLGEADPDCRLDLGCVAAHGIFVSDAKGGYEFRMKGKPATAFLFELITRLQNIATVPMIDLNAYGQWLTE